MNGLINLVIYFVLTITAAVIYMFFDMWIYITNGFEYIFKRDDSYVHVCVGMMHISRQTIWHHNFDNNTIFCIQ